MADYEVVWNGRGPLPGLSGDGFVQKDGSYLTRGAEFAGSKRTGDLPTQREMVGKTDLDGLQIRQAGWIPDTFIECGCGKKLTRPQRRQRHARCYLCQRLGRHVRRKAA